MCCTLLVTSEEGKPTRLGLICTGFGKSPLRIIRHNVEPLIPRIWRTSAFGIRRVCPSGYLSLTVIFPPSFAHDPVSGTQSDSSLGDFKTVREVAILACFQQNFSPIRRLIARSREGARIVYSEGRSPESHGGFLQADRADVQVAVQRPKTCRNSKSSPVLLPRLQPKAASSGIEKAQALI